MEKLKELQNLKTGLWHTVLTDPDSYVETSGTAAITAGILKGIRCGILDVPYLPCAVKAIRGILDRIDSDGTVLEVSGGTGMGMDAEHYKNILIAPMAYGQSPYHTGPGRSIERLNRSLQADEYRNPRAS